MVVAVFVLQCHLHLQFYNYTGCSKFDDFDSDWIFSNLNNQNQAIFDTMYKNKVSDKISQLFLLLKLGMSHGLLKQATRNSYIW